MPILTSREGEELILTYQDITIRVMVTDIHGKQAKIGIDAPWEVDIVREPPICHADAGDTTMKLHPKYWIRFTGQVTATGRCARPPS